MHMHNYTDFPLYFSKRLLYYVWDISHRKAGYVFHILVTIQYPDPECFASGLRLNLQGLREKAAAPVRKEGLYVRND